MPHFTEAHRAALEMIAEERKILSWFFTFGHGHPLQNCYVGVIAPNAEAARVAMFRTFRDSWGFQYETNDTETGLAHQVQEYGLQPVFHFAVEEVGIERFNVYLIPQHQFTFASAIEKRRGKAQQ